MRERSASLVGTTATAELLFGVVKFDYYWQMGSRTPSGEEGSISCVQKCLLDVIQVMLVNMDFFTSQRSGTMAQNRNKEGAEQTIWEFGSFAVLRKGSSLLKDKCILKLQVERNLDGEFSRIGLYFVTLCIVYFFFIENFVF